MEKSDVAIYIWQDNHIYIPLALLKFFEEFYVGITTVLDENKEPHFIKDVANDIAEIVHDIIYDGLLLVDEEEERFIRIPYNKLEQHLEECVKDEVKSKISLKTEKDIAKYPDFTESDILYHKERYYSKVGSIDQYHFTLAYIIAKASDEYDRFKKAKKAIKKRTIATFEMVTRDIYVGSGENMKIEKLTKGLEKLPREEKTVAGCENNCEFCPAKEEKKSE